MRVGTICFAIERGLGHLAKSFYDNGIVTDPIVLNHGRIPERKDWYPNAPRINVRPNSCRDTIDPILDQVDWMLFFETPFDWEMIEVCRQKGVKTALMVMHECTLKKLPYEPDLYLCPSPLDQEYFPENSVVIPVPVEILWRQRTIAKTFVHNAGYVGLRGRNGTLELLQAMQYVMSPIELTVRAQTNELLKIADKVPYIYEDPRVKFDIGILPFDQVWSQHDVAIQPEKFNGLSLPLQEARASGMLVITTDRYPANTWLPKEPLIEVNDATTQHISGRFLDFQEVVLEPLAIAKRIDEFYDMNITDYSLTGRDWAKTMSWNVIKPLYIDALQKWLD